MKANHQRKKSIRTLIGLSARLQDLEAKEKSLEQLLECTRQSRVLAEKFLLSSTVLETNKHKYTELIEEIHGHPLEILRHLSYGRTDNIHEVAKAILIKSANLSSKVDQAVDVESQHLMAMAPVQAL